MTLSTSTMQRAHDELMDDSPSLPERVQNGTPAALHRRGLSSVRRVDLAGDHAPSQRLGRDVHEIELIGLADRRIGQRLALSDAAHLGHDVIEGLQMLDVQGADDVDARLEQLLDVLPTLCVSRAGALVCASSSMSTTCG